MGVGGEAESPSRPPAESADDRSSGGGAWLRALGLFVLCLSLPVVDPAVLVGLPYLLLVVVLPARRLPALLAAGLAVFVVMGGTDDGVWMVERGWTLLAAGWFAALVIWRPDWSFTSSALASIAGATAVAVAVFAVRPEAWSALDWAVADLIRSRVSEALALLSAAGMDEALAGGELTRAMYEAADRRAELFPATLGLGTMAGLGVAWWMYFRLAQGRDAGLYRTETFRFNDHLVWLFIAGLAVVLVVDHEASVRLGWNVLVFMGALYVLRGFAVARFFGRGIPVWLLGLLVIGLLPLAPVVLTSLLTIGLGDTWLDLRTRSLRSA